MLGSRYKAALALAALPLAILHSVLPAQENPGRWVVDDADVRQKLSEARERVAEGQYAAAAGLLGELLERRDDPALGVPGESGVVRSVKAEAEALLGSLPAAGREQYEALFGAVAREKLRQAAEAGNVAALAELTRNYFFTKAGEEAVLLVARYYWSSGQPVAASLYARRLLRHPFLDANTRLEAQFLLGFSELMAGQVDQADRVLREWREKYPADKLQLGGKEYAIFSAGESPSQWLSRVARLTLPECNSPRVWSGDLAGAGRLQGDLPWLDAVWAAAPRDAPVEAELRALETHARERRLGRIPTMRPLLVGPLLIARTASGLTAIEVQTGRARWRVDAEANPGGFPRRVWDDVSWGAISTNGDLVFAIEDWEFDSGLSYVGTSERLSPSGQEESTPYTNYLAAYDVRTGKLRWQAGTVFGLTIPALREGRFLSVPVPLDDRLYAVVEFPDGCRLVAFDARGEVRRQWTLDAEDLPRTTIRPPLAVPQWPLSLPAPMRLAPPVYSQGVLVCATSRQELVAVDLVAESLLWRRPIEVAPDTLRQGRAGAQAAFWEQLKAPAVDRWSATAASVLGDQVLLTPFESEFLFCLDLRTGRLNWKAPRRDGLFVAGVANEVVLVVGRAGLLGYRLADGAPAWPHGTAGFASGSVPSGTGYFSHDRYCLPFATGEIGVFDVRTGRLVTKVLPTTTIALGHLIPHGEAVFSAGISGIHRLRTLPAVLEESRVRWSEQPLPTAAALNRARVLIAGGAFEEALALLAANDGLRDSQSASLFLEGLALAVRAEPKRYLRFIEATVVLAREPAADRVRLARLAEALSASEQRESARVLYTALIESRDGRQVWVPVSAARSVRLDRQAAAGLQRLGSGPEALAPDPEPPAPVIPVPPAGEALALLSTARIEVRAQAVKRDPLDRRWQANGVLPVVVESCRGPVTDLVVSYEVGTHTLVGQDRWGRMVFEVGLPEVKPSGDFKISYSVAFQHAALAGQTLVYHRGDLVAAVDLAAAPPRLAWSEDPWPREQLLPANYQLLCEQRRILRLKPPAALHTNQGATSDGTQLRWVAATGDSVVFHRGCELVCVDPRTGEEYWRRNDLPVGADLLGGPEHLLVTPLDGRPSTLLAWSDGRDLAERPTLPLVQRIAADAGRALLFDPERQPRQLGLYDPSTDRFVWRKELPADAVPAVGPGPTLAIVAAGGTAEFLDLRTGQQTAVASLGPLANLQEAALFPYDQVTVLAVNQTADDAAGRVAYTAASGEISVHGALFGLDSRRGQVLWTRPLRDQKLRTTQPFGLPLIVASNGFQRESPGSGFEAPEEAVDCVDIRSGEVLKLSRRQSALGLLPVYRLGWEAAAKAARLETGDESLELRFVPK